MSQEKKTIPPPKYRIGDQVIFTDFKKSFYALGKIKSAFFHYLLNDWLYNFEYSTNGSDVGEKFIIKKLDI